jgi:hypothetical protein
MLAAAEEDVDSAAGAQLLDRADLVVEAQLPVPAVVKAGRRWLAVLVVELAAEEEAEALVELLSRQSFSAAMARSTT